ncbi:MULTISPECIES: hypothetical protein [unclassified Streptomyces]|nr:hypothetical protein OG452_29475 [Streptomyces sp. NBC_01197]WSS48113.1 hypothetical protein OG708_05380 [Streptomyces sp. NBC_01180]
MSGARTASGRATAVRRRQTGAAPQHSAAGSDTSRHSGGANEEMQ